MPKIKPKKTRKQKKTAVKTPKPKIKKEKKKIVKKEKEPKEIKKIQYWEGVGRRKTAVARVRVFKDGEKKILVNNKEYQIYFPMSELSQLAVSPLKKLDLFGKLGVSARVKGGGVSSQAGAVRHGLARALLLLEKKYRPKLRRLGYLTRDPRMRERKKFGLKRARKAPQWSKR